MEVYRNTLDVIQPNSRIFEVDATDQKDMISFINALNKPKSIKSYLKPNLQPVNIENWREYPNLFFKPEQLVDHYDASWELLIRVISDADSVVRNIPVSMRSILLDDSIEYKGKREIETQSRLGLFEKVRPDGLLNELKLIRDMNSQFIKAHLGRPIMRAIRAIQYPFGSQDEYDTVTNGDLLRINIGKKFKSVSMVLMPDLKEIKHIGETTPITFLAYPMITQTTVITARNPMAYVGGTQFSGKEFLKVTRAIWGNDPKGSPLDRLAPIGLWEYLMGERAKEVIEVIA